MKVVTRFAPSPTGYLHIGGARTALFNWLFAKHHGGIFRLRIEDTDKARSTEAAIEAIFDGLNWLGLTADDEVVYQSRNADRHAQVAWELLEKGRAYKCFTTAEELARLREEATEKRNVFRFQSPWRNVEPQAHPENVPFVIRLKAPEEGVVVIEDEVQGHVNIGAGEVEDVVLLRSDGTPTYMLAVVVDDHDMAVTHVIRGDDHLTNSAKQILIYQAMDWNVPVFAHIPLIHGPDGAKLSKRHGALGVDAYRDMGYLPEAMRNYLLRLGWAYGDEEIFNTDQMIEAFTIQGIGKSPSRIDFKKMENLNGHYIRLADNARLLDLMLPLMDDAAKAKSELILKAIPALKERAKTILELAASAKFLISAQTPQDDEAKKQLAEGAEMLKGFTAALAQQNDWNHDALMAFGKTYAEANNLKLGKLMGPVRVAITGSTASPSMFEVMEWLGKEEALARLNASLKPLVSAA